MKLLQCNSGKLVILDHEGAVLKSYVAPGCGELDEGHGTFFRARPGLDPFFAAVVETGTHRGTRFFVYDSEGKLVYNETNSKGWESIVALPSSMGGRDSLLVGGIDQVLEYSMP